VVANLHVRIRNEEVALGRSLRVWWGKW
jgi:hypothetical protein